jgi:tetratricopeptide (TPR) repeat protein
VKQVARELGVRYVLDAQRAKELIYRSLLLNPNSATPLTLAANLETCPANPAKALELLRRAERLNPRDPRGWIRTGGMAFAHFVEGRFDEAASWAQNALAQSPRSAAALQILAASLAKLGQSDKAGPDGAHRIIADHSTLTRQ